MTRLIDADALAKWLATQADSYPDGTLTAVLVAGVRNHVLERARRTHNHLEPEVCGPDCPVGWAPINTNADDTYPGQPGSRTIHLPAHAMSVHVALPGRHDILNLAHGDIPRLDHLSERDREVTLALLRIAASEVQQ